MQEKNSLKIPIRYFKGVGPKRSAHLEKLGIHTVEDLLYHLPARYEDRSRISAIKDLKAGDCQMVRGEVVNCSSRLTKGGIPIFQMTVTDHTGFVHALWFNQPYLKDRFKRGDEIILYGKVEMHERLQIIQPEYEILGAEAAGSTNIGRIVPVYPLVEELTQRYLRKLVFLALSNYSKFLAEKLPTSLLARQRMVDLKFAIRNIHFPSSFENLDKAYRRIVFEEFFLLQLAFAMKKDSNPGLGLAHNLAGDLTESFKRRIPFKMTEGQRKAIADIERDMSTATPMNRLVEGDVGSGKTVVASYAIALTVQNGFQAALMAPTEVLARQHFVVLSELLMPLGVNIALLVSGIDPKTKARICADMKEGRINVVVGTHAIIQKSVDFKKLGLVVVDEQHKFGVTQRADLMRKGHNPHALVMTATPIPRTLALTVYGDLDVSVIREMPKGRRPISTYWVEEEKRDEVYNFIKEELRQGRQAYVVCPLIDRVAGVSLDNELHPKAKRHVAVEMYMTLKDAVFAGFEVGLLHGRMISKEKDRIMREFKRGKIRLLVSTSIIEVGIDIPNASVMLVENAERFGLSQLHQLRGRIGRGEYESYFILLADPKTEMAKERLKAVEGTLDGFEIAEADLNIRGPGEIFGTKQHGLPEVRFGNIVKDVDIMELAKKEASALVAKDPKLEDDRHRLLKGALVERFKDRCELGGVG